MKIEPFKLERFFAKYEFTSKYLLSSSDCDGFSLKEILSFASSEEQELWNNLTLGYTESQGLPRLREEIAKLYTRISEDQITVLTPEEGIFVALNCILNPDDHVISISPSYQSLHQIVKSIGCDISFWLPNEENGWYFNPDDLPKLIRPNTKLLIINFPHNPTGYQPTLNDFQKIIEFAKINGLFLFSDEMYRYLEHESLLRLPSASDLYSKAISLSGLSKTFGLAGLRIGWLTTQDNDLMKEIIAFKDYTTICNSAPSEILGLIGLRHKEKLIEVNLQKIKRNLSILNDFLVSNCELFSWNKPKAGTIGFVRLNLNLSSLDFCEKTVKETGIMIVPSEMFEFGDKHIRIGFGRENLPTVLEILNEFIKRNQGEFI